MKNNESIKINVRTPSFPNIEFDIDLAYTVRILKSICIIKRGLDHEKYNNGVELLHEGKILKNEEILKNAINCSNPIIYMIINENEVKNQTEQKEKESNGVEGEKEKTEKVENQQEKENIEIEGEGEQEQEREGEGEQEQEREGEGEQEQPNNQERERRREILNAQYRRYFFQFIKAGFFTFFISTSSSVFGWLLKTTIFLLIFGFLRKMGEIMELFREKKQKKKREMEKSLKEKAKKEEEEKKRKKENGEEEEEGEEEEGETEIEVVRIKKSKGPLRTVFDVVYLFFSTMSPTYNIYRD